MLSVGLQLGLSTRMPALAAILLATMVSTSAFAQGSVEPTLSGVKVQQRGTCSVVRIEFHRPVQYLSHGPQGSGDDLRVVVKSLDRVTAAPLASAVQRESLRPPAGAAADIHAIEFERDGLTAALKLYFRRTATYQVAGGADGRSIVVALAGRGTSVACAPTYDDNLAAAGSPQPATGIAVDTQLAATGAGQIEPDKLAAIMVDARAAMAAKQDDRALQLLTRVTDAGESKVLAEALELSGVVRERKGHLAHARAEYQQYLTLFPHGDGAGRIRQRLGLMDAKEKATFDDAKVASAANDAAKSAIVLGKPGDKRPVGLKGVDLPSQVSMEEAQDLDAWRITQSGSVATTYQRNQGGRDFFTAPKQNRGWEKENVYQVYQNSAVGTLDDDVSFENRKFKGTIRFSASQEYKFSGPSPQDDLRISQLFLGGALKGTGLSGRIGRQSAYGGGVLGRFDGAIASYEISERYKLNVVGGSPVERARDGIFSNNKVFYGTSLDLKPFGRNGAFETSIYAIEQRSEGYVDRQSIGTDLRFNDSSRSAFTNIDYDVHYNTINMALLTGTKIFADTSSISTSLDYRRSPMVFTTNAMQGQGTLTLKQLLDRYRLDEVETFALDRTARSTAATVAYSKPLSERYQVNADVTVTNMSATKGSGGVPGSPDTGVDVYTSLQLTGTSIMRAGDVWVGGVRYADTQTAHRSMLELSTRQPIGLRNGGQWYANPLLRLGFADYKGNDITEYHIMPTFRTSYYWTPTLSMELELGQKWIARDSHKGRENESETLLLTGIRYDFNGERTLK
jgi:hypothetical protein